MNRFEDNQINNSTNDPEEMMMQIMDLLSGTVTPIPDVGGFYTFIYNAKTPNISYDQHPLIACTEVMRWGFRGINLHLRKSRQYAWDEVAGQLYIVQYDEVDDLMKIPYRKMVDK